MDLVELLELTEWVEQHVRTPGLVAKYAALRDILQANASGGQQQPFERQKNELLQAVRQPLDELSHEQQELLDRLDIGRFLGPRAVTMIEDVLYRNALDVSTAAQRMGEAATTVERGIARVAQIREGLDGLVSASDRGPGAILIRVTFAGQTAVTDVVQLKKWTATWHGIARGIAGIHGLPPEDVLVIGAGRGSLIIDLSVKAYVIAHTLSFILLRSLAVTERVVDIKIKGQELRGLMLTNEALSVEAAAEKAKREAGASIVQEVVVNNHLDAERQGEEISGLTKAVKDLLNFLEKGGAVDLVLPPPEEQPADAEQGDAEDANSARVTMAQLREQVEQIRQLEARVRLLEAGRPPENPTAE